MMTKVKRLIETSDIDNEFMREYNSMHKLMEDRQINDYYEAEDIYVVRRRGHLAPRQLLIVCTLLPTPREEQASTASWKPRPPFEAAEMD